VAPLALQLTKNAQGALAGAGIARYINPNITTAKALFLSEIIHLFSFAPAVSIGKRSGPDYFDSSGTLAARH
jgi:hypothetical protein